MHPLTHYLAARLREQLRNPHKPRPALKPCLLFRLTRRFCHRERPKSKGGAAVTTTLDKPQPPRRLILWRKDPRCFWCGRVTIYATSGTPNAATLEHIYPRGHPRRSDPARHLPSTVLACYRCNQERGAPIPTTSQACPVLTTLQKAA